MDRETFDRESALNRRAYESLREQIQRDYAGQYVALANGRIVATATTFDETTAAVEKLDSIPEYCLIFPADLEPAFDLAWDISEWQISLC